jgi:hypothetical protein
MQGSLTFWPLDVRNIFLQCHILNTAGDALRDTRILYGHVGFLNFLYTRPGGRPAHSQWYIHTHTHTFIYGISVEVLDWDIIASGCTNHRMTPNTAKWNPKRSHLAHLPQSMSTRGKPLFPSLALHASSSITSSRSQVIRCARSLGFSPR